MRKSRSTTDVVRPPTWGRVVAVLSAATLLIIVPGIAQAAFTVFAGDHLPVSSAQIPASTATVSASCQGANLTITVTSWDISDPRFIGQFIVTSGGGTVLFTGASNQIGGGTYSAKISPHTGTWNWTTQNQYPIPGTHKAWTGGTKAGTFTCT